jgi:putative phosphoesterase
MRIGLIGDIHCDLSGLGLALDLLREKHVDPIVCMGDIVEKGDGPDADAVIELLTAYKIPCVQGNHDFDAAGNQRWLIENGDPQNPNYHRRILTQSSLGYVLHLPDILRFEWEGQRVLLAHGAPWSAQIYIYPNSPRDVYDRIAVEAQADVVILGHTHQPMRVELGDLLVINPGSVCGHGDAPGSRTCGILSLPERTFEVYDLRTGGKIDLPVTEIPRDARQPGDTTETHYNPVR